MKPNPFTRFTVNFLVYLVFGGGIFAFVSMQGAGPRPSFSDVVIAALSLAIWSGSLTTVIELVISKNPNQIRRTLLAGAVGACSLGGFALILSQLAWHQLLPGFIATGFAAGSLMQAARAFSLGARAEDAAPPHDDAADDAAT